MIVVVVKWKITPGREELTITNPRGLVGEFMCEPGSQEYITWSQRDYDDSPCTIFVNVAIWASAEAFGLQVEPKFDDDNEPEPFEPVRRVRTVFGPSVLEDA